MNNLTLCLWTHSGGPVPMPGTSPDLNKLDFFLWKDLEEKVYKVAPTTK